MILTENEKNELTNRFGRYIINAYSNARYADGVNEYELGSGRTIKYIMDSVNGSVVLLSINEVLLG